MKLPRPIGARFIPAFQQLGKEHFPPTKKPAIFVSYNFRKAKSATK